MKSSNQTRLTKSIPINEKGAIDLASTMIGVVVIGVIGSVIAAIVFLIIPWAQDKAAKHQLESIVTAENTHMGMSSGLGTALPSGTPTNTYADSVELENAGLLQQNDSYCVIETPNGKAYNAFAKSGSGRIFTSTSTVPQPELYTGTLPAKCSSLADGTTPPAYVDPTPTLTKLTYMCDVETTGTFAMQDSLTGTADWNDGTGSKTYSNAATSDPKTLEAGKEYKLTFDGTYKKFNNTTGGLYYCLRSLDHWGSDTDVVDGTSAFAFAQYLTTVPENIPPTITNASSMFMYSGLFNSPNVSKWNTSNITNMNSMFGLSGFNQPLNDWDVSSVTTMNAMFSMASQFDQPLEKWNTSNVTNMTNMFSVSGFNQPLNDWDVSNVITMDKMFSGATKFNQPLNNWNVSNVTTMNAMFHTVKEFNQPLSSWKPTKVTDMSQMFLCLKNLILT